MKILLSLRATRVKPGFNRSAPLTLPVAEEDHRADDAPLHLAVSRAAGIDSATHARPPTRTVGESMLKLRVGCRKRHAEGECQDAESSTMGALLDRTMTLFGVSVARGPAFGPRQVLKDILGPRRRAKLTNEMRTLNNAAGPPKMLTRRSIPAISCIGSAVTTPA